MWTSRRNYSDDDTAVLNGVKTNTACNNCRLHHKKCTFTRPCEPCIKRGIASSCYQQVVENSSNKTSSSTSVNYEKSKSQTSQVVTTQSSTGAPHKDPFDPIFEGGSTTSVISVDVCDLMKGSQDGSIQGCICSMESQRLLKSLQEEVAMLKNEQKEEKQEIGAMKGQIKLLIEELERMKFDNLSLIAKLMNKNKNVSIALLFVNYTPELEKYLNLGFGIYYIFFFFTCAGFYLAMGLRVRRNSIDNADTTSPARMTTRLIFLHISMILLAIAKAFQLLVLMTEFKDPMYVVGLREMASYMQFGVTIFTFVVLTVVYHHGSTVVYGKRTSGESHY